MALKAVWSNEAEEQLREAIEYLEANWTNKEIKKLFHRVEKCIANICKNPEMYKKSERLGNTRECVVSKHYSLFYTYDSSFTYIVVFWNNYKDLN